MASNDEYQQERFFEINKPVSRGYFIDRDKYGFYLTAPLDPVQWIKVGDGWEFKLNKTNNI